MTEKLNADADEETENEHLPKPLIKFPGKFSGCAWTIRNAVEGVQIFGGIGSGKTSGSGRYLALKYLKAGFGGLVLTVKLDEKKIWKEYCDIAGRSADLTIIEDTEENYFNFLEYESENGMTGNGVGHTANIVQVLKTVIQAGEERAAGVKQDPFWDSALDMLISHVIDLCKLAYGHVTVQQMYDIVQSLPRPETLLTEYDSPFWKAVTAAKEKVDAKEEEWKNEQPPEALAQLESDKRAYDAAFCEAKTEPRLFRFIDEFFFETYMKLAEKTRSIIDFSFSGFLFGLLRDPVYTLFCRHTSNVRPEDCLKGKIILLNLPVKLYHKVGRDSQILFKYIWQRAMERRKVERDSLPVFLWADEAQNFLHEHDAEYQATARSSLIATVYLSQNLPNYNANMGGAKPEYRVKSFLGTLATKIFHANADIETNRYASELIGDRFYEEESRGKTIAGQFSATSTDHLRIDRIVRPEDFHGLATGSKRNDYLTTAYLHFQGNVLRTEKDPSKPEKDQVETANHIRMHFHQKYEPKPTH